MSFINLCSEWVRENAGDENNKKSSRKLLFISVELNKPFNVCFKLLNICIKVSKVIGFYCPYSPSNKTYNGYQSSYKYRFIEFQFVAPKKDKEKYLFFIFLLKLFYTTVATWTCYLLIFFFWFIIVIRKFNFYNFFVFIRNNSFYLRFFIIFCHTNNFF